MVPVTDRLLTVQEAAEFLQIRPATIYMWIETGRLPHYRIGGRAVRFSSEQLQEFLEASKRDAS